MFAAEELAAARAAVSDTLTDSCTVQVGTPGVDDLGTPTVTYTDTVVSCRVGKLDRDAARYFAERFHAEQGARFTFPYDVLVAPQTRITFGGVTYRVEIADATPVTTRLCTVVQAVGE